MTDAGRELEAVLAGIRSGHDMVPFMDRMIATAEARLAIVPDDMMHLLAGSADFRPLDPGAPPTWFQVSADEDRAAELVIYRARADGRHYVVAPS